MIEITARIAKKSSVRRPTVQRRGPEVFPRVNSCNVTDVKFDRMAKRSLRCSLPRSLSCLRSRWVRRRVLDCFSRSSFNRTAKDLADSRKDASGVLFRFRTHNSSSSVVATTGLHKLSDTRCTGNPSRSHRCAVRTVR